MPRIRFDAVQVAVQAGKNDRPAGRANGVGDEGVPKQHALVREAVEIGGGIEDGEAAPIGAERLCGMIVRKDEDDIGAFGGLRRDGRNADNRTSQHPQAQKPDRDGNPDACIQAENR